MLLSTYDPTSQAWCPQCKRVVVCDMLHGNMWSYPYQFTFECRTCHHVWQAEIGTRKMQVGR